MACHCVTMALANMFEHDISRGSNLAEALFLPLPPSLFCVHCVCALAVRFACPVHACFPNRFAFELDLKRFTVEFEKARH